MDGQTVQFELTSIGRRQTFLYALKDDVGACKVLLGLFHQHLRQGGGLQTRVLQFTISQPPEQKDDRHHNRGDGECGQYADRMSLPKLQAHIFLMPLGLDAEGLSDQGQGLVIIPLLGAIDL